MTTSLFAYGTLSPGCAEEVARGGWEPDMVRGRMYDLGRYPALVDVGDPRADWVEGYVRAIDLSELSGRLDTYEGVGEGLYRRVEVTTRAGRRVWVYEYAQPLPPEAHGPMTRWDGPRAAVPPST
jgi:gamma-glutamylcyclotransferase (GGCT)/AIG2-like uncharacterized protein YtfP